MGKQSFRIVIISDMDPVGSGYASITTALAKQLFVMGHQVKVIGMVYNGEEHRYPFSLFPCAGPQDAYNMLYQMKEKFNPDIVVGLADIPNQEPLTQMTRKVGLPYICITPMENGPLCLTWAMILSQVDKCYMMSEFAVEECRKVGVDAEHLVVGVDCASWHPPLIEERQKIRESYGLDDNDFVILTVADNQERKNLWGAFEAVAALKKKTERPIKYWLVTRENQFIGYRLRDMAKSCGILKELTIFERGLPFSHLWGLFAAADVFLLSSKAEGLGLPVLEAMACRLPVVANRTGALPEHLADGRGYLAGAEYSFIDTWGNSRRDMMDPTDAANRLLKVSIGTLPNLDAAREYVLSRTWEKAAQQLVKGIEDVKKKASVPSGAVTFDPAKSLPRG